MDSYRASSKIPPWSSLLLHAVVFAVLTNHCFGEQSQLVNPNGGDPNLDPNIDQFWAFPVGRAGYPLNDQPPVTGPGSFPSGSQPGVTNPGGAAFYPGPIPGTVQVGYFSGPSVSSSFPPGSYGFNGNGVFGFNIPANAVVQQPQQQTNQQSPWGSGFWSRFNPVNRVGSLFNFPQRPPVHQYAFSASITNNPNNRQQPSSPSQSQSPTNPSIASPPYFYPSTSPQSDYKPWYNAAGYVPFGNSFYFPQNPSFAGLSNAGFPQNSDPSGTDATNKQPLYPPKPSIPLYNTPNVPDNSDGNGSQSNTTSESSLPAFGPNQPVRNMSPAESSRPGFWGENLRRNWLHVPWIGNFANRDVTPRTEYPGATLFSLQG